MPFGQPVLDTVTAQPRERERDLGVNPSGMAEMRRETGSWGGLRERTDCGGGRILPNPKLGG